MSFSGDLEHLPIVDVIQLIHSTQKTGTLRITNGRSECQLVFEKGYIVSANHANNNVRIGNILVKNGAITEAQLEQTLAEQSAAGDRRQPLIAALIEGGSIKKEDAFKGLESLIHLTIVQILSWNKGTFILDVESGNIGDNYRYFPEQLHEDFLLGTQGVLMDALRIFDEKMRDGELEDGVWADEDPVATETDLELSAELLGLDELDKLERAIPQVYAGLRDHPTLDLQRERLRKLLAAATEEEQECFDRFLKTFTTRSKNVLSHEDVGAIVLFSHDELLKFTVITILKQLDFQVFATGDATDLEFMTGQYLSKGLVPLVFFDSPVHCDDGATEASVTEQRRHLQNTHPQAAIVQLASPATPEFSLQAYRDGVLAVMPRWDQDVDIDATIAFYRTFQEFSTHFIERQEQQLFARFSRYCDQLEKLSLAPELSAALLTFVSEMFQRGLTLIVAKNELIAERGIGINTPREDGPTRAPKINLPLEDEDSIFRQAVTTGKTFYAESNNAVLKEHLFSVIGTPRTERVLLLPFKSRGRVIALIYADFGENAPTATHIGLLKALADHAGLVLDEALFRKQLEKTTH